MRARDAKLFVHVGLMNTNVTSIRTTVMLKRMAQVYREQWAGRQQQVFGSLIALCSWHASTSMPSQFVKVFTIVVP
jgi:hypothetical protein